MLLLRAVALLALAHLGRSPPVPCPPATAALTASCGGSRRAGVGDCLVCVARHFSCPPAKIDRFWDAGAAQPPLPPPMAMSGVLVVAVAASAPSQERFAAAQLAR